MKKLLLLFIGLLFWTGSSWGQTLSESFENQADFPPDGWEVIYGDNNPDINTVNQSGDEHYQGLFSFEFRSFATTNPYDQYLITPELIVNEGDQVFSFQYKRGSNSTEIFRIGWSSTGKEIGDFSWSDDETNATNAWQRYLETDLPVGTKYVVIHYRSVNKFSLFVDEVFGPTLLSWNPPHCAINASPYNQSTEVHAAASLNWQWNSTGGLPTGYKLYFGTNNPPTNIENGTDLGDVTTYDPAGDMAYNTTYYWSVLPYNLYGEPYDCPVWSFTTSSDPTIATFPHTQAFEGETFPPTDWQEVRTPASGRGWASSNSGLSGKAARFDSYNNLSGNISRLITPPFNLSALSTAQLTFNYKNPKGGDLSVLLSTDGGLSYPHTLFTGLTNQVDWTEKIADISAYIGSNVKIAFQGISNYGSGDAYIYLDNITIGEIPTCPAPILLTAVNILSNSADLGWTEKGNATTWEIEYKAGIDFTPGTGAAENIEVTSNPFSLTGLESSTKYYWYVKAVCGVNDDSYWVGPGSFTTEFGPKTTPYFEGFEIGNIDNEAVGNQWVQEGISGYSVWRANNTDANFNRIPRNGAWNALLEYTNKRWMFQRLSLVADKEYTFDMYANEFSDGPDPASLTVKYGLSSSSTAMTKTIVEKTSTLTNDYQLITGTFTPTETRSYSIGIFGETTYYNRNICIDDIAIYETPACPAPLYLNETDVTLVSAKLGWTERGSASNYNVVWGEAGFDFENGTVISNLSENFALLSGLTANTAYEWYVQANCSELSTWVGPKSFSTKRITPLPYFQGFTSDLTPEGWETTDWEIGEAIYNAAIPPIDGNYIYADLWGTIEAQSLTTINMGPVSSNMFLSFDYSHARYSNGSGLGSFTVSMSTDYGQTYTVLETIANTNTSAWQFKTIALNGYQGQDIKIKITANRVKNVDYPYNFAIDNFSIASCPAPSALTASNIRGNSADLGWTENGGATAWNIKYGTAGFDPDTEGTLISGVDSNPYTLTALLRETNYHWYVQAACGGDDESVWVGPHSFTTVLTPMATPFFEGFEHGHSHAGVVANGWTQQSASGNDFWTANNWFHNYGRSPRTGSWNATLRSNNSDWLFQKLYLEGGKSYTVDMWARKSGNENSNFVSLTVKYGLEANAASMQHAIAFKKIENGAYQIISGTFIPESTGIYAIGFYGYLTLTYDFLSIDDIAIYETPDCHAPYESFVSNVTGTTADLSWSARGAETSWNIKYGPVGFTPANAAEGTLVSGVNTNAYTLTGLSGKTNYDYYVQAACSDISQSEWTGPTSFTTGNEYYTIPYVEGFETDHTAWQTLGNDWRQEMVTGDRKWEANDYRYSDRYARTGNWYAYLTDENAAWMFQKVLLKANTDYTFEMYARQSTTDTSNVSIAVSYGTTANAEAMTNEIVATTNITNGGYQIITGNFRPTTAGIYAIGILGTNDTYSSNLIYYLSIDDITIYESPACPAPHSLTVSTITPSSATLGWTERGEATMWNIKYGAPGFNPANAEEGTLISNVNANPYVLSGLQSNTTYDWYVQAACSEDETSTWTGPKSFTTACNATSIPYFENFDAEIVPALPRCMLEINANEDGAKWVTDEYYAYSKPNAAFISYNNLIPMNDWLFTEGLMLEAGKTYELGFAYGSSENYQEKLSVYWGANASVAGMTEILFSNLETYGREWHTKAASLSPSATGTYYIGFKGHSDADKFRLYLDDIYVVEQVANATWTGAQDNNWNNADNWSTGVPGVTTDVIIPAGLANYPTISGAARCNKILLQSNASGTASLLSDTLFVVNGTANVERYITGGWGDWNSGWHQISSPVAAQAIDGFATGDYDFYGWDEPTKMWMNHKEGSFSGWNAGTNFNEGQGYLVSYNEATSTKTFTGQLNAFNVTLDNLSKTDDMGGGWHLLGNPFVSALKWNDGNWQLNNVAGVAKIWSEPNKSYSDIEANGIIPSAQGFMVQVSDASNRITIPEASRVHNNTAFYKSGSANDRILLVAAETEGGSAQESKILINPLATKGFDFDYDSRFVSGYAPLFYAQVGDESLSTYSLSALEEDLVIPFGFVKNEASEFTITLKENIAGLIVYLTDKQTGKMTNLSENPVYSFSAATADDAERFLVSFGAVGLDQITDKPNANAYAYDNFIYIETPLKQRSNVNVYNISGQLVLQGKTNGNTLTAINASALRPGIYVVHIALKDSMVSRKIIINN